MYGSCSHLVWAIILHMIIIILFLHVNHSHLPMHGVLARWSHLICLWKDQSGEVVLSLRSGGLALPKWKTSEERGVGGWCWGGRGVICHRLIRVLPRAPRCSCRSPSRARRCPGEHGYNLAKKMAQKKWERNRFKTLPPLQNPQFLFNWRCHLMPI